VWASMIQRCTNPKNKFFHCYGGKGIKVCQRWLRFENFLSDMGPRPKGRQIDRKNNRRGYFKSNCRWVTKNQQARNRSNNHNVTFRGETMSIAAWAEKLGVRARALQWRLSFGWPIEEALTKPYGRGRWTGR
jgi:hypothetical protein